MLNAWVCRCPHCVSFSMDAESTTTKLQRLWRWNKTTLLRSTKNKQEEAAGVIDEDLTIVSQDNTKPQLTCIFFIFLLHFETIEKNKDNNCPKYYSKINLLSNILTMTEHFAGRPIFLLIIQDCQLSKVMNNWPRDILKKKISTFEKESSFYSSKYR